MASQPANATIRVHRRVRSYRQMIRHNNIKAMCNRMRPLIMSVPSRETQILSTFDGDANIVATALTNKTIQTITVTLTDTQTATLTETTPPHEDDYYECQIQVTASTGKKYTLVDSTLTAKQIIEAVAT